MSEENNDDKQFDATEQKLRKAREKGDIPRSTEVNAACAYLGAFVAAGLAGGWLVGDGVNAAKWMWAEAGARNATSAELGGLDIAGRFWVPVALSTLGVVAVPAVVVLLALVVQRSIVFVPSKLAPDVKRINPVKNAAQKFGKSGLITFSISAAKAISVGIGGWLMFRATLPLLTASRTGPDWVAGLPEVVGRVLMLALGISIIFAATDLAWKHYDFRQRNRMTMKELKDEMKDSEGDPHMKSARRQKSMEIVLSTMLADVETADVVVVNPTHYAVALKWQRGSGRAPVCVAKGVDEIALRIRERASKHEVPIWPDPPCARAIHASVKIGEEIQPDHFAPVAAAIRFAEAMREKARKKW